MKTEIEEPLLTPREVQRFLQIGEDAFRALVKSGRLKAVRVGNTYRISKNAVADFLRGGGA